jgi:hypothetical protein
LSDHWRKSFHCFIKGVFFQATVYKEIPLNTRQLAGGMKAARRKARPALALIGELLL